MLLKGLIQISRPLNSFLSGFAVVIGAIAAISHPLTQNQLWGIVLGYLTTSLVAVGGYAINDVFDIEIDKINMPHRPLPSGYLTLNQAKIYAIILFIIGNLLALMIDVPAFLLAFSAGLMLYMYAAYFKRAGFLGNIMIGILTAVPFIFGGLLTASYETMIFPALFAFLLIAGREVIKDIEDVRGDRMENVKSIALMYGVAAARNLGYAFLVLLMMISPLPILLRYYSSPIFIVIVLGIDLVILFVGYLLFKRSEEEIVRNTTRCKRLLKTCISFGILAFVIEGLGKLLLLID
ncbi:MAG: geranylgeranylglycerol-phosphate geranylgeranyltransferase [Candidatus Heimdallarchaeota archaeon]